MLFKCAGLAQKNMLPNPLLSVSNKQILTQSFDTSSNIEYDNIIIANSALLPSVKRGSRVETLWFYPKYQIYYRAKASNIIL